MNIEDAVYLACLIDSEGCISGSILPRTRKTWKGNKVTGVRVVLQISQRDPRVLHWVKQTTSVGGIYLLQSEGRNPTYVWSVTKQQAVESLLLECLPYMKVKPEQAKCGLKAIRTGDPKWVDLLRRLKRHIFV